MNLYNRLVFVAMILVCIVAWSGCCCPNKSVPQNQTENQSVDSSKADSSKIDAKQNIVIPAGQGMKVSFSHPVVMVNGKRATDELKTIEMVYPINSTQPLTLVVIDPEGTEQTLQGQIKIFSHTKHTNAETVVVVAPDDPETTYYDILRNGYGEISVCEYIQRSEIEEQGAVLLQITLGSKKKIQQSMIEFRFREGSVDQVNGQLASYTFPENAHQDFLISLEQNEFKAKAKIQTLQGNYYTTIAPVWIELNDECKTSLRNQGEVTLALYIPSAENQIKESKVIMVDPVEDIKQMVPQYGTLVGVLTLRRING